MVLILYNTVFQIVFIALPTKLGGTVQWPGFLTVAILLGSTALLAAVPVRYSRLEEDLAGQAPVRLEKSTGEASVVVGCAFDRGGCLVTDK